MATQPEIRNLALFCDFENVALGVREARYAQFDINKVLEKLLLKGSIVVKKAYCDWERYKEFRAAMHYASFELIEVPHPPVGQELRRHPHGRGRDLCAAQSLDAFVIVSGDSDFSPLVSKLRENNKTVIGVGVKKSTSDLLVSACDEFIYYDDLVREDRARKKPVPAAPSSPRRKPAAGAPAPVEPPATNPKLQEALDLIVATVKRWSRSAARTQ
jgi:hypothetical protein